ncbi:hypothetical protein CWI39_1279p0010, partial [Hamiltosporidium magnivora]
LKKINTNLKNEKVKILIKQILLKETQNIRKILLKCRSVDEQEEFIKIIYKSIPGSIFERENNYFLSLTSHFLKINSRNFNNQSLEFLRILNFKNEIVFGYKISKFLYLNEQHTNKNMYLFFCDNYFKTILTNKIFIVKYSSLKYFSIKNNRLEFKLNNNENMIIELLQINNSENIKIQKKLQKKNVEYFKPESINTPKASKISQPIHDICVKKSPSNNKKVILNVSESLNNKEAKNLEKENFNHSKAIQLTDNIKLKIKSNFTNNSKITPILEEINDIESVKHQNGYFKKSLNDFDGKPHDNCKTKTNNLFFATSTELEDNFGINAGNNQENKTNLQNQFKDNKLENQSLSINLQNFNSTKEENNIEELKKSVTELKNSIKESKNSNKHDNYRPNKNTTLMNTTNPPSESISNESNKNIEMNRSSRFFNKKNQLSENFSNESNKNSEASESVNSSNTTNQRNVINSDEFDFITKTNDENEDRSLNKPQSKKSLNILKSKNSFSKLPTNKYKRPKTSLDSIQISKSTIEHTSSQDSCNSKYNEENKIENTEFKSSESNYKYYKKEENKIYTATKRKEKTKKEIQNNLKTPISNTEHYKSYKEQPQSSNSLSSIKKPEEMRNPFIDQTKYLNSTDSLSSIKRTEETNNIFLNENLLHSSNSYTTDNSNNSDCLTKYISSEQNLYLINDTYKSTFKEIQKYSPKFSLNFDEKLKKVVNLKIKLFKRLKKIILRNQNSKIKNLICNLNRFKNMKIKI